MNCSPERFPARSGDGTFEIDVAMLLVDAQLPARL